MRGRTLTHKNTGQHGFTIVEVMMVLAVTGLMFVAVAIIISGKQQTTQFQTAMNNLQSQVRQVANQVNSGYFPDAGTLDCDNVGSVKIKNGTTPTSGNCNFIGKALHFYSGSRSDHFSVYTILGLSNGSASYSGEGPLVVAASNNYNSFNTASPPHNDVTDTVQLSYGLAAGKMTYVDANNTPLGNVGSFGFMQSLNQSVATGNGRSQHVSLVVFTDTAHGQSSLAHDPLEEADTINSSLRRSSDAGIKVGGTVSICFDSGTTKQHGTLTVSQASSNLDVSSQIGDGPCS